MARRPTTIVGFSIGIAATRVGMHPQTLREYERKGLVNPHRTPGGARRYRDEELERLRRIQQLTEQGLSLAGVAYVLALEHTIRQQSQRIDELERRLRRYEPSTPLTQQHAAQVPVLRSMSVELVHVPRQRRGPRWTNRES